MSSFDTYQDLAEEVADMLGRSDLTEKVPGWLELVESEMQKEIRDFRETLIEATGNFVAAQEFITLPTGLREAVSIRIDTSPARRMDLVSHDKLIDIRVNGDNAGIPYPIAFAYAQNLTLLVAPTPSGTDGYTILYHGALAKIDGTKTTSQVLRDTPEALFYGAVAHGCNYVRNWDLKREIKPEYERAKSIYGRFLGRTGMGGGTIRIVPDNVPRDAYSRELANS